MLQHKPSRYSEIETAWITLANSADACKELIHEILDNRSEWNDARRSYHTEIEAERFSMDELQLQIDMLVENVTHLTVENHEKAIHIAFFSGKRIFFEVNNIPLLDQRNCTEVAPELLEDIREKVDALSCRLASLKTWPFSSRSLPA